MKVFEVHLQFPILFDEPDTHDDSRASGPSKSIERIFTMPLITQICNRITVSEELAKSVRRDLVRHCHEIFMDEPSPYCSGSPDRNAEPDDMDGLDIIFIIELGEPAFRTPVNCTDYRAQNWSDGMAADLVDRITADQSKRNPKRDVNIGIFLRHGILGWAG